MIISCLRMEQSTELFYSVRYMVSNPVLKSACYINFAVTMTADRETISFPWLYAFNLNDLKNANRYAGERAKMHIPRGTCLDL